MHSAALPLAPFLTSPSPKHCPTSSSGFHVASLHLNGLSSEWRPGDDQRIHWADGEVDIAWPDACPMVSALDAAAPRLSGLRSSGWSLA